MPLSPWVKPEGFFVGKMKTMLAEDDDDAPPKLRAKIDKEIQRELEIFGEEVIMFSRLKRTILRKKLKKEKVRILCELIEVKRKLKILDELDEKDKLEKVES